MGSCSAPPLLTTGTASADQFEGGGRQVIFGGGGVLGLSCRLSPTVESMTVPAESTLHVVNRTGHDAGWSWPARPGLGPGGRRAEVVFRRGTTR